MNVKKTMLVAVALATVVTTSFAAKTNPDLQAVDEKEQADPSEGHYKAPKSYGWSVIALGLATPVQLPWGIEKWGSGLPRRCSCLGASKSGTSSVLT